MSWAEVKKINSDLTTPLNELIECEQPPYHYSVLSSWKSVKSGAEVSITGPALIYAITGEIRGRSGCEFGFTITLDNLFYDFNVNNSQNYQEAFMAFCVSTLARSPIHLGTVGYQIPIAHSGTSSNLSYTPYYTGNVETYFMPPQNTTNVYIINSSYNQLCMQILDKPIKVNSLAKIRFNTSYSSGGSPCMLILYKPLS